MSPTAHVLVADDQPDVREALRLLLKGEGYAIETAASPAAVLAAVQASDFDAVLLDLNYARDTTTGREGLELVSQLQALDATLPTVVMTAWGSVEKAVEAMRRGRPRFHREAVGQQPPARHAAHAGGAGPGASEYAAAGDARTGCSVATGRPS